MTFVNDIALAFYWLREQYRRLLLLTIGLIIILGLLFQVSVLQTSYQQQLYGYIAKDLEDITYVMSVTPKQTYSKGENLKLMLIDKPQSVIESVTQQSKLPIVATSITHALSLTDYGNTIQLLTNNSMFVPVSNDTFDVRMLGVEDANNSLKQMTTRFFKHTYGGIPLNEDNNTGTLEFYAVLIYLKNNEDRVVNRSNVKYENLSKIFVSNNYPLTLQINKTSGSVGNGGNTAQLPATKVIITGALVATFNSYNEFYTSEMYRWFSKRGIEIDVGITFLTSSRNTLFHYYLERTLNESLMNGNDDRIDLSNIITIVLHLDIEELKHWSMNVIADEMDWYKIQLSFNMRNQDDVSFYIISAPAESELLRTLASYSWSGLVLLGSLGFPLFLSSLFLVEYSFNLIKRIRTGQINILKTRGASLTQMLLVQIAEILLIALVSLIIGIVISTPLFYFTARTNGFLRFEGKPLQIIFPNTSFILNLFVIGVTLSFLTNIGHLLRSTSTKIVKTEIPVYTPPIWRKKLLDVFLIFYGTLGIVILFSLRSSSPLQNFLQSFTPLLSIIILTSPFALGIGFILFVSRLFNLLLDKLAFIAWKMFSNIAAFSFKQLAAYKHISVRTAQIIMLTLTISFFFLSFQPILQLNDYHSAYYAVGADMRIGFKYGIYNISIIENISKDFSNDILGATPVGLLKMNLFIGGNTQKVQLLIINATSGSFLNAAYVHPKSHFPASKEALAQLENNFTIFLLKKTAKYYKIKENITIPFPTDKKNYEKLSFKVLATFEFLSTLINPDTYLNYQRQSQNQLPGIYGVISFSTFHAIKDLIPNTPSFSENPRATIEYYLYIKTAPKTNTVVLKSQILERYPYLDISTYEEYIFYQDPLPTLPTSSTGTDNPPDREFYLYVLRLYAAKLSFFIFNMLTITGITITSAIILFFGLIFYNERWKELGVEQALGMKKKQIYIQIILSLTTLFSLGFVMGTSGGIIFLFLFIYVFYTTQQVFPPLLFVFPQHLLVFYVFAAFFSLIVAVISTSLYVKRRKTLNLLKVE